MTKYASVSVRVFLCVITSLCAILSPGQTATGFPPFNSFAGGPADSINLANLNVHFAVPVFSRPGRGIAFNYALNYDSSVWYQTTSSGNTNWQPVPNWGWKGTTEAVAGYASYVKTRISGCSGWWYTFSYHDPVGTVHTNPTFHIDPNGVCANPTGTAKMPDGSGFTMSVDWSGANPIVTMYPRSGGSIVPPVTTQSGAATITDSNGNQITTNGTSFTDTLSTTAVLTVSGTNPVQYSYTSPAGTQVPVSVHYSTYQAQTNFQCSGVIDYGPTAVSLVSSITLPDGSSYSFTYEPTPTTPTPVKPIPSGAVTGRIHSITLPTGGTLTYTYTGGNNGVNCSDGSAAGLNRQTPDGSRQYARSGTPANGSTTITTPVDPKTGQTNQTVLNFSNGYETQRKVYQGAVGGTPLETIVTCYNGNSTSCAGATVNINSVTQLTTLRQFNGGAQTKTDTFYNSLGLVTERDEYDYGATSLTRKTVTSYASLGNYIADRPSQVQVFDSASNLLAQTSYQYDEASHALQVPPGTTPNQITVSGSRGNLTTMQKSVTASSTLDSHLWYYNTGALYQVQDPNQVTTTYSMSSTAASCGNTFATSISMPLSLSKSYTWNCSGAALTQVTDENSQPTSTTYNDPYFWRPAAIKDPLLNSTQFTYSLNPVAGERSLTFGSSTDDTLTTLDGLGRALYVQRKQSPSGSAYDSQANAYDALGRLYQTTMPYSASASSPPPTGTPLSTTYYDALDRIVQIVDGSNAVVSTTTYNQNDVYQDVSSPAGENDKRKQLQYDGLGRLSSVCEVTSGSGGYCGQTNNYEGYLTTYTYDTTTISSVVYNRLTVTQNAQPGGSPQSRTYISDLLGRLVQETNPETGTVSYYYDSTTTACPSSSAGDMIERKDAAGNITCYYYDSLHRLTDAGYSGPVCRRFRYDSRTVSGVAMANAKGRLAEAMTDNCGSTQFTDEGFSYSARGELTDVYQSTPHSNGFYHSTAQYYANGALQTLSPGIGGNQLTLPWSYGVDGEGRTILDQNTTYNTASQLTKIVSNTGDNDVYTYDPNTGRMKQYQSSIGTTPTIVTGKLSWNTNGTLQQLNITDGFSTSASQTCNYGYDDLSRIASVNCTNTNSQNVWNQNFGYDPFGNITKTVPPGGTGISWIPGYDTANNNRYASGTGAQYDSNGNLLNDTFNTYSWDPNWQSVASITPNIPSPPTTTITYDALGRAVEFGATTFTEIMYGPTGKVGLMNGQTEVKAFQPLPGGGVLVHRPGSLTNFWRHPDWLGSSRLATTTPGRTKFYDGAYAPFGEDYLGSGAKDLVYTGQEQDMATNQGGLYDFLFCEYSPRQGRWISPDPGGKSAADPSNPQTWNRYAYVTNDPLSRIDPKGLFVIDCAWEGCSPCPNCGGAGGGGAGGGPSYTGDTPPPGASIVAPTQQLRDAEAQAEAAYSSWIDMIWHAGGSVITPAQGVPVAINWSIESGVYGVNLANGMAVTADGLAELTNSSIDPDNIEQGTFITSNHNVVLKRGVSPLLIGCAENVQYYANAQIAGYASMKNVYIYAASSGINIIHPGNPPTNIPPGLDMITPGSYWQAFTTTTGGWITWAFTGTAPSGATRNPKPFEAYFKQGVQCK